MDQARVVVAEAQPITRLGLRVLLEEDPRLTVVGEAGDGEEVVRMAEALAPDVVLLDVDMPGMDALDLLRQLRGVLPRVKVLVLSASGDPVDSLALLEMGAVGHLLKGEPLEVILAAVHRAAQGESSFVEEQLGQVRRRRDAGRRWTSLTGREREVLALLAEGHTNRQIAQALGIAPKTAEHHVASVLGKLGVASRGTAAVWAVGHGFVEQVEA